MMLRAAFIYCLLPFILCAWPLHAQPGVADTFLQPVGKVFTLRNGLAVRLYATQGGQNERTEVRLAMRVGSTYENKKEEGVAHCIEHMACAPEWITRTLSNLGNRYGSDFNAYTGYDRTVYSFSIPSGNDSAVRAALQVVKYWLADMQFPRARVEQEKGIIAREIADFAPEDPLCLAKLQGNARYDHFPIGREDRVRRISARRLAQFYRRHYSPATATLAIAGPIDSASLRQAIEQMLGDIPSPRQKPSIPEMDIFASLVPTHILQPASADSSCSVSLFWPYRYGVQETRAQWLRNVCAQACISILNEQLYQHGNPLTYGLDWYLNHEGFFSLMGYGIPAARVDSVIAHAMGVLHGVATHCGKTQLFDALREKALAIAQRAGLPENAYEAVERMVSEALVEVEGGATVEERKWIASAINALDTATWREALIRAVPNGAPLVTSLEGSTLSRELMARTIAKGDSLALLTPNAHFIVPNIPSKPSRVDIPTGYNHHLFPTRQPHSKVYLPTLDANLYALDGGVPMLTRRTRTDDSTVYIVATWRHGLLDTATYSREEQEALYTLFDLATVPTIARAMLDSLFYQEGISQLFTVSPSSHRVMVASPASNMALAVRLLRDRLLSPSWDSASFAAHRDDYIESARETAMTPRRSMHPTQRIDAFTTRLIDPGFSVDEPGETVWQRLRTSDLHRYFNYLYAKGKGLQLVAVGPVEGDSIAAAVAKNFDMPHLEQTPLKLQGIKLWHPEATSKIPTSGPATFIACWRGDIEEQGLRGSLILKMMRDALQDEVLRTLRMETQLVYSPFVSIRYDMQGSAAFSLIVQGECDANVLAEARHAAEAAVEALSSDPISKERIGGYQKAFLAAKDRDLTPFAATAWRDWLVETLEEGATPVELDSYSEILHTITPEMIQNAFKRLAGKDDRSFLALSLEE